MTIDDILARTEFTEHVGLNLARAKELAEAIDANCAGGFIRKLNLIKALRAVSKAAYSAGRAASDPVNASATVELIQEDLAEIRDMMRTLLFVKGD